MDLRTVEWLMQQKNAEIAERRETLARLAAVGIFRVLADKFPAAAYLVLEKRYDDGSGDYSQRPVGYCGHGGRPLKPHADLEYELDSALLGFCQALDGDNSRVWHAYLTSDHDLPDRPQAQLLELAKVRASMPAYMTS